MSELDSRKTITDLQQAGSRGRPPLGLEAGIHLAMRIQLECFRQRNGANTMAISREQARSEHTTNTSHDQFSETIYGVVCSTCHNYILIDKTNCPASCRDHETCRAAYA
jgi:hypothetical protein